MIDLRMKTVMHPRILTGWALSFLHGMPGDHAVDNLSHVVTFRDRELWCPGGMAR